MVSIQWLRAFAVVMVIIFHVLLKAQILGLTTLSFSQGAAGVDLFFIISGFIMVYITQNRKFSFIDFIKRRIIRIIPLYWILSSIAAIVYFYNPLLVNSHNGETSILSSFTLIPIYGKAMLLEVGWTLRFEFFFYTIFAISMYFFRHNAWYCVLLLILTSAVSLLNIDNFYIQYFTNPIIIEFSLGIFSFHYFMKTKNWLSLTFILMGFFLFIIFGIKNYGIENRVIFYGIPMFLFFLGSISLESIVSKQKTYLSHFFKYIGDASYSLYLSHTFTIAIIAKLYIQLGQDIPYLFFPLSVIASVLAGAICYEWIEKPITKLIKQLNTDNIKINNSFPKV